MPAPVLETMLPDKHNATPAPGRMVQVCGLVRSPQLNGLRGEIESHTDNDRWIVKLQHGHTIALKRINVQTLSPPPADYDMPTPILPPVPSSTYEPASASTPAPTPSPTNTFDNMPKPSAHTPNHSPTSLTTLPKMRWSQEEYSAYQWQEDTRGAATQNTTHDKDDNRPGPSAHTSNDNHTPHTTPHTKSWWVELDNGSQWQEVVDWMQADYRTSKWREDIRSVATRNTYQEYEGNTVWEPTPREPTPSPPEEPPPTLRRSPPPSPRELQREHAPPPPRPPLPG